MHPCRRSCVQLESANVQLVKEAAAHARDQQAMQQKAVQWETKGAIKDKAHSEAQKVIRQLTEELDDKHRATMAERARWAEVSQPTFAAVRRTEPCKLPIAEAVVAPHCLFPY